MVRYNCLDDWASMGPTYPSLTLKFPGDQSPSLRASKILGGLLSSHLHRDDDLHRFLVEWECREMERA